jgi:hypothetical protein
MTELLEKAVAAVRRLSPEEQVDIARIMLRPASREEEPEPIDPDHLSAVLEGLTHADRRDFASDAEVEVAFRRFG